MFAPKSNSFHSIIAIALLSLSTTAIAQSHMPAFHHDVDFAGTTLMHKDGSCTELRSTELQHHLGSISIPGGQRWQCSLYTVPRCGAGQGGSSPICVTRRSLPDLLTLEGNPCVNAQETGAGYLIESVYCYQ